MTWDKKCWGIFSNIYWTTRFIGMRPLKPSPTTAQSARPIQKGRSVYVREGKEQDTRKHLASQEEVLNHFFNITFDIASDVVVSQLFCQPLGISDRGPFASYSRGFQTRFGWAESENTTQPDAFFCTEKSLIGVELKLASKTWPEQIAKYLALMHYEEECTGHRDNLGLLFIVPDKVRENHLLKVGVTAPTLGDDFIARLNPAKLPRRIRNAFEASPQKLDSVRRRIRLASISWTWLRDQLKQIEAELDPDCRGGQTLLRLLVGFRSQVESHGKTGIPKAID